MVPTPVAIQTAVQDVHIQYGPIVVGSEEFYLAQEFDEEPSELGEDAVSMVDSAYGSMGGMAHANGGEVPEPTPVIAEAIQGVVEEEDWQDASDVTSIEEEGSVDTMILLEESVDRFFFEVMLATVAASVDIPVASSSGMISVSDSACSTPALTHSSKRKRDDEKTVEPPTPKKRRPSMTESCSQAKEIKRKRDNDDDDTSQGHAKRPCRELVERVMLWRTGVMESHRAN
ncbi:hypothetical protein HDU67_001872 [Dinochytrium kinnereticum]|nr:hypothetical protein HDU67_001872 [Dinochytrium kinnereticum]